MAHRPLFSVVIPTRNRATLLPTAIQGVLGQTCQDFEIIVSDNFSADGKTREAAMSFGDSRIRYVRTPKSLPINESWQYGLEYINGQYVAFCSDDDVFAKVMLASFESVIREHSPDLLACGMPQYYEEQGHESAYKFSAPCFTNKEYLYDVPTNGRDIFRYMFAKVGMAEFPVTFMPVGLPYLANAAYKSEIFTQMRATLGSVFPRDLASTDVYSTSIILSQFAKLYCYVDKPLYIQRVSDVSLTRSPDIEKQKKTYGKPSHDLGRFASYFVDFSYSNLWVEACLLAAVDTGFEIDFELSWPGYYLKAYDSLMYLQDRGFDMTAEIASFFRTVDRQSKSIKDEVLQVVNSPRARLSRFLRTSKLTLPLLRLRQRDEPAVDQGAIGLKEELTIDEYAARLDDGFLANYAGQGITI